MYDIFFRNTKSCFEGNYGQWFESCTINKLKNVKLFKDKCSFTTFYFEFLNSLIKGSDCCSETQTISFHNIPPEWQLKLKNLAHLNFTKLYQEFLK